MKKKINLILLFMLITTLVVAQINPISQMTPTDLADQIQWVNIESVELAVNDFKSDNTQVKIMFAELEILLDKGFEGLKDGDTAVVDRARKALELQRSILLLNPVMQGAKIVASRFGLGKQDRKAMAPKLGTQANNWSNQQSNKYYGYDADIIEISNFVSSPEIRTVYKPQNGEVISDLKLHWDAERLMFTSVAENKMLNVFEVKRDGSGLRKMIETDEEDLEFYDATYLPDGRIMSVSNIGYQAVPCVHGDDPVGNSILYNPKDKNIRRLTFDQDANWNPVIMNNGKIMYTRWEYTDLMHYYSRFVMTMNPDGTEQKALFGSGTAFPNSTFDMQILPGGVNSFSGIISGHHGVARSGRFILFDPLKASKGVEGMIQEIPFRKRPIIPIVKDYLVDGVWPQFIKPMPITDKYFLVAAKLQPKGLWGIYLVDVFDNVTCLYQSEGDGYISPILVQKRSVPPIVPDRVNLADKEATLFIQDIYEGEGLRGVPRGTVKKLRLHTYGYAYHRSPSNHEAMGIQSGWDMKRNLGTVDVEKDGSVICKVPANTPISIQPLDEHGRAIQWMRSWLTGMPGEVISCVGCHEDAATMVMPKRVIASTKEPAIITPPEGGLRPFTFDLEVQPVLDRACVSCHNGEDNKMDLRGGKKSNRGFTDKAGFNRYGAPLYSTSYLALHPYVRRQGSEADMAVLQPYEYYANTSEFIRMLENGHHGVSLTEKEWYSLTNWIDYNAPEKGVFVDVTPYRGHDQYSRRIELGEKYAGGTAVYWKKELQDYAKLLDRKKDVEVDATTHATDIAKDTKDQRNSKKRFKWSFSKEEAVEKQSELGETTQVVEVSSDVNLTFRKIPRGKFLMGNNSSKSSGPRVKVNIKKSFWITEVEITNEQYNSLIPEHDSRYVDQLWKDHVHNGYSANLPHQPVIRVSYQDAVKYCQKLSEKIGKKVILPTEKQWEWACRAGSDQDFWYGNLKCNFGEYENLADESLEDMAVRGVDPQPVKKTDPYFKWYSYHPKENSVNDGAMIQNDSKKYKPNPFGLYSMHGNIAELTSSNYKDGDERVVIRGGSYMDRPCFSTAHVRKGYYPWQRVFNVGFRVIIEE